MTLRRVHPVVVRGAVVKEISCGELVARQTVFVFRCSGLKMTSSIDLRVYSPSIFPELFS